MKSVKAIVLWVALLGTSIVSASDLAGVPMKDYHVKALGGALKCELCHQEKLPKTKPTDKACIQCHGTMDKIATPANEFDKKPHASDHYGNTLECTTCHAEHKPSQDLCSTCHRVKWQKFQ